MNKQEAKEMKEWLKYEFDIEANLIDLGKPPFYTPGLNFHEYWGVLIK